MIKAPSENWLRCGSLVLDVSAGRVFRAGVPVSLDAKPLQVLLALARSPDRRLSKDALVGAIWGGDANESVLTQSIFRLRQALEDSDHQVIVVQRNFGYALNAQPATPLFEAGKTGPVPAELPTEASGSDTEPQHLAADRQPQHRLVPAPVLSPRGNGAPRWGRALLVAVAVVALAVAWLRIPASNALMPVTDSNELAAFSDAIASKYPARIRTVLPRIEKALQREPDSALLLALYSKAWSIDYEIGSSRIDAVLRRALPAAQRAVALAPDLSDAHSALGLAMLELDRLTESQSAYQRALELAPESAYAWSRIGLIQSLSMRPLDATQAYARAADRFDGEWNQLGQIFNQAYAGEHRSTQFEEMLKRYPGNVYVAYEYAWTEHWAGRTTHAREIMEAQLLREPGQAWTITMAAELRRLDGDEAGAAALMQLNAPLYNGFDGDNSLLAWRLLSRYAPEHARALEQVILGEQSELGYLKWSQAEIWLARGESEKALRLMDAAWDLDLANGVFLRNWRIDLGTSELMRHEELLRSLGRNERLRKVIQKNEGRARMAQTQGVRAQQLTDFLARYGPRIQKGGVPQRPEAPEV